MTQALQHRAEIAQRWLIEDVLPFWWAHGFDHAAGCFHERLDAHGAPVAVPRRIRGQARHTFAYARAVQLGWPGPWREAAGIGVDLLIQRGLRADGGTIHALGADGAPADTRRDLYDISCVLLALAEAARALGRADALEAAERLLAWCEANWALPSGGYAEGEITEAGVRRQNPHMHMFEALLALYEASGRPAHLARANEIAALMADNMFDPAHGALREYFDDAWRPLSGERGAIAEPGHEFEWAWLLSRLHALGGAGFSATADKLRTHAEKHGVQNAFVIDEITLSGAPRTTSPRLWPQTERLKAHLAHFEATRDRSAQAHACEAFDALWSFRNPSIAGSFRDRRDAEGAWIDEEAPSSSLYHITLAVSELIRVSGGSGASR